MRSQYRMLIVKNSLRHTYLDPLHRIFEAATLMTSVSLYLMVVLKVYEHRARQSDQGTYSSQRSMVVPLLASAIVPEGTSMG